MSSIYSTEPAKIQLFTRCDARLTQFPRITHAETVTTVDVSKNPIQSFEGMVEMPEAHTLIINDTEIKSFLGALALPNLRVLQMDHTPLSMYQHVQLMAAIVFGEGISRVNKKNVLRNEARLAYELRELLFEPLVEGWIITSVQPIRLFNTMTQKRKVVYKVEKIDHPLPGLDSLLPPRTEKFTADETLTTTKIIRRKLKPLVVRTSPLKKSSPSTPQSNNADTAADPMGSPSRYLRNSPISSPIKSGKIEEKTVEEEKKQDLSKLSIEDLLKDSDDEDKPAVIENEEKTAPATTEEEEKPVPIATEEEHETPVITEEEHEAPVIVEEEHETPVIVEEEKPEETPVIAEEEHETPVIVEEEKQEETPVIAEEEKQEEAPVIVEEEKQEEAPVIVEEEKHEETPVIVEEEKPAEVPVQTEEKVEEKPAEKPTPVKTIEYEVNSDEDVDEAPPMDAINAFLSNLESDHDEEEEEQAPEVEQTPEVKEEEPQVQEREIKLEEEPKAEEKPQEEAVAEEKQAEDVPHVGVANNDDDDEGLPNFDEEGLPVLDDEGLPNLDDDDSDIIIPDLSEDDKPAGSADPTKKSEEENFFDQF